MATQASNDIVFSAEQLPVSVTGMQSMAGKMWLPFLAMGFMIIVAAFIVGLVNTATTAAYFENSKEQREEAPQGSDIATQKAFIEATKTWLPAYSRHSSSLGWVHCWAASPSYWRRFWARCGLAVEGSKHAWGPKSGYPILRLLRSCFHWS